MRNSQSELIMSKSSNEAASSVETSALGAARPAQQETENLSGQQQNGKSSNLNQSGAPGSANGSATLTAKGGVSAGGTQTSKPSTSGTNPNHPNAPGNSGAQSGKAPNTANSPTAVAKTAPGGKGVKPGKPGRKWANPDAAAGKSAAKDGKPKSACFNCGVEGHKANACRQPQKSADAGKGRKDQGRKGHKDRDPASFSGVKSAHEQYVCTDVYVKACKVGFDDKAALDKFNSWVKKNVDKIDPRSMTFCENCGEVLDGLELCDCFIRPADAAPVDPAASAPVVTVDPLGAIFIPTAKANIRRSFWWVNGVRHYVASKFAWPSFNWTRLTHPNIGGFNNESLGDDEIIPSLYTYLTLKRKADYTFNGVDDRRARVAHFKTLSQHWLDENDIKAKSVSHEMALRIIHTIQRAADGVETNMLLDYTNPVKNSFWEGFGVARVLQFLPRKRRLAYLAFPVLIMALSPELRIRLYRACMRPILSLLRRHVSVAWEASLLGSWQVLTSLGQSVRDLAQVIWCATSNGRASLLRSSTQLSSTATAGITSMYRSISGICETSPFARGMSLTMPGAFMTSVIRNVYRGTTSLSPSSATTAASDIFSEIPLTSTVDPVELAEAISAARDIRDSFYREALGWEHLQSTRLE